MLIKTLTKTSKLGKNEIRDIRKLVATCAREDGVETKFYWNILKDRKIPEFDDFFYYIHGNLVGYLATFVFKEDEAEINAIVHPKYRNQGIFKKLFNEAITELRQRKINYALLLCQEGVEPGETIIKNLGTQFAHYEYEMTWKQPIKLENLPEVTLRDVGESDVFELARMDSASFGGDMDKLLYRFMNGLKEKDRVIWMAVCNGKDVGKMHVRFDEGNKGYIHDLCVPPENQGKGYATGMVMAAIEKLKKLGMRTIFLDVAQKNIGVTKLYEKCGFEHTATFNFWRYPVVENPPPPKPEPLD